MSALAKISCLIKSFFCLDPIPHDKFDEWPVSTRVFLHQYHEQRVDRSRMTKCISCSAMESDGACVYLLDGMCMLDGLTNDETVKK